ncbi:MAG TPA: hypothetical protein PLR06_08365 [Cyclobacteriaceae bacterium]|nr:hypothetical protein [Cyclobacteriaceae bacterium]
MKRFFLLFLLLASFTFSNGQQQHPDTVKVGAYIISVHDINFHDKEYTIRFWLWFLHDNPDFDFKNQLDIPNAKEIDEPEVITDTVDGKIWVQMKMKCVMKESWNVQDFPFDEQRLRVRVENTVFDKKALVFKPDKEQSMFDNIEGMDGWEIKDFSVSSESTLYGTGFGDPRPGHDSISFSTFKIDMNIERDAWGLFMKIFIGMYIAFLIALISFSLHPWELEPRFGLPVGGLFAAVGNKYIIDSLLPESPEFSLVDTLHSITFFGIMSILAVSAISLKFYTLDNKVACLKADKIGSRLVVFFYLGANLYFILKAYLF